MLDQPLPQVTLDGALVEDARRTFSRVTLAERVYSAIQRSAAGDGAAAVAAVRMRWVPPACGVFMRGSGKPMTDGIPGFFTVDGFYKVLLPQLPDATRQVASESWVLGKQSEIDPDSPQVHNLQQTWSELYTDDYAKQWDAMLNEIDVEPLTNMQQAVQDLYVLSSPQSPMSELLTSIARQLTLTQPPAGAGRPARRRGGGARPPAPRVERRRAAQLARNCSAAPARTARRRSRRARRSRTAMPR